MDIRLGNGEKKVCLVYPCRGAGDRGVTMENVIRERKPLAVVFSRKNNTMRLVMLDGSGRREEINPNANHSESNESDEWAETINTLYQGAYSKLLQGSVMSDDFHYIRGETLRQVRQYLEK